MKRRPFTIEVYAECQGAKTNFATLPVEADATALTFTQVDIVGESIDRCISQFLESGRDCQVTFKVRARLKGE